MEPHSQLPITQFQQGPITMHRSQNMHVLPRLVEQHSIRYITDMSDLETWLGGPPDQGITLTGWVSMVLIPSA